MTDIIKNPIVMAVLIGGAVFVVMNYCNPQNTMNKKQKKHRNRPKSFLGEPKETNILISILVSLGVWYYLYTNTKCENPVGDNKSSHSIESVTSSEARRSYNLLGKGLQLPNGQQLPDIFHKLV